jgi:hypothetical protein
LAHITDDTNGILWARRIHLQTWPTISKKTDLTNHYTLFKSTCIYKKQDEILFRDIKIRIWCK